MRISREDANALLVAVGNPPDKVTNAKAAKIKEKLAAVKHIEGIDTFSHPDANVMLNLTELLAGPEEIEITDDETTAEVPAAGKPTKKKAAAKKGVSGKKSPAKKTPTKKAAAKKTVTSGPSTRAAGKDGMSCTDAAAQVLKGLKTPLSCPEMIDKMAEKGLWSSPTGKTPAATLQAKIIREIKTKGGESRFVKTGPGRFANPDAAAKVAANPNGKPAKKKAAKKKTAPAAS